MTTTTAITLIAASCALGAAFATPALANPVNDAYFTRDASGPITCKPKGPLLELVGGKYTCVGLKGASVCAASLDAAQGKLEPQFAEMFVALLQTEPADGGRVKHLYQADCVDLDRGDGAHNLAFGVLSYGQLEAAAVAGYARPEVFATLDGGKRADFVSALGRYRKADRELILPALKTALATKGSLLEFKKSALNLMARLDSDDGVDYCMNVLTKGEDKHVTRTCAWYLGERKATAAVSPLLRGMDKEPVWFVRALGVIGSGDAIEPLREVYEKLAGTQQALPATVALLNLGDKAHPYEADLLALIAGRRPLSLKDREKKAEELKAKKKNAAANWKKREEAEAGEGFASAAAFEATYVVQPTAAKKVDEALRAAAKHKTWDKAATLALSALAQRGDKAATAQLVKLLDSPKEKVREIALDAFGARYEAAESFPTHVGRVGIVANPAAVEALVKYIASEPNEDRRAVALQALGAVRSLL